jgi:hypothetical protein
MTDDDRSPERKRLDAWSADNPRDDLGLVAIAAWLNVAPEKLPKEMRYHTSAATKEAWDRVVQAIIAEAVERATRVKPLVWQDFANIEVSPDESVSDDNLAVALCSYFDTRIDCPDDDEEGGELDDYDCWKVWVSKNSERVLRRIAAKANLIVETRIRAAIGGNDE